MSRTYISVLSESERVRTMVVAAIDKSAYRKGYSGNKIEGLLTYLLKNSAEQHLLLVTPEIEYMNACSPVNLRIHCLINVVALGTYLSPGSISFIQNCQMSGYVNPHNLDSKSIHQMVESIKENGYLANEFIPIELWKDRPKHIFPKPKPQLTKGEDEVLKLLCHNYSVKEIAFKLGKNEPAVRAHIRNLMEKLYAQSITELVAIGLANMWYPFNSGLANGSSPYFGGAGPNKK